MPVLSDVKLEQFAQAIAKGTDKLAAYDVLWPSIAREKIRRQCANRKSEKEIVKLRINELVAPVIEQIQKKHLYDLDQALKDIDGVIAFARAMLQPAVELRAIELKGKFVKMLGSAAEMRTGTALDALSTEDLLEMQQILKERKQLRQAGATPGGRVVKMAG